MRNKQVAISLSNKHPYNGVVMVSEGVGPSDPESSGHIHFLKITGDAAGSMGLGHEPGLVALQTDGSVVVLPGACFSVGWFCNLENTENIKSTRQP